MFLVLQELVTYYHIDYRVLSICQMEVQELYLLSNDVMRYDGNLPILKREKIKMTSCYLPKAALLITESGFEPRPVLLLKLVVKSLTFIV